MLLCPRVSHCLPQKEDWQAAGHAADQVCHLSMKIKFYCNTGTDIPEAVLSIATEIAWFMKLKRSPCSLYKRCTLQGQDKDMGTRCMWEKLKGSAASRPGLAQP